MRVGRYRAVAVAVAVAADGRGVSKTIHMLFHFKFFECVMKRAMGGRNNYITPS